MGAWVKTIGQVLSFEKQRFGDSSMAPTHSVGFGFGTLTIRLGFSGMAWSSYQTN